MNKLLITEYEAGQRLDKFLRKYFNDASPGFVYKMLRKKRIKRNGARADGGEVLAPGDELTFYIAPETMDKLMSAREFAGGGGVLDIVYEDENILAVNKPRGILTHPGLIDQCLAYLHESGGFSADKTSVFTPAFCNRLDRNTSGIVLCGKNPAAMRELNRAIAGRCVDKYYLAVVVGEPPEEREVTSYHHTGKEMITGITTLATAGKYSLLSVKLITGRKHQIRAQLSALGAPVAGDAKYGGKVKGVPWQLLHAERVAFGGLSGGLEYLNGKELYTPPDEWFLDKMQNLGLNKGYVSLNGGGRQYSFAL
ncbi:MAG: RluA family pseudouridine synthase [Defluviitaleaceae bacterium]|nr:RluA family pseudouridine synthase [Defluviitaleaceae bacterium]